MKGIKVHHPDYFPEGGWVRITNECKRHLVNDDDIYFYMEDSFDLESIRVGDTIELDEIMTVMGVEE